jgi:hypothetical protein
MHAMIRTAPPQAGQISISIPQTRFRRCAQIIAMDGMYAGFAGAKTGHRGAAFGRCRLFRLPRRGMLASPAPLRRCHPGAEFAVRRKDAVETGQIDSRFGHQGRQPGDDVQGCTNVAGGRMPRATEVEGFEDDVRGAVAVRGLQLNRSCASLRPRQL